MRTGIDDLDRFFRDMLQSLAELFAARALNKRSLATALRGQHLAEQSLQASVAAAAYEDCEREVRDLCNRWEHR